MVKSVNIYDTWVGDFIENFSRVKMTFECKSFVLIPDEKRRKLDDEKPFVGSICGKRKKKEEEGRRRKKKGEEGAKRTKKEKEKGRRKKKEKKRRSICRTR